MPEVEITELEEFEPTRVDGVGKGANGFPILMMKGIAQVPAGLTAMQDGSLVVEPGHQVVQQCPDCKGSGVNVVDETSSCPSCGGKGLDPKIGPIPATKAADDTGEPCATCKGDGKIRDGHMECPDCGGSGKQADVEKATVSTADQNDLPDSDFAYIEDGGKKDGDGKTVPRSLRHFPIMDAAHVRNALSRAPQSPFGSKAMPAILAAAKKFDIETSAEKAAGDMVPGDDGIPGSKTWEAADAARLLEATQTLLDLKCLLDAAAEREQIEGTTVDPDDLAQAWTLQDATWMLQNLLGVVAAMAAIEQRESDNAPDEMEMKSVAVTPAGALAPVAHDLAKAGKVLSSKNLAGVKAAITALQDILSAAGGATNDGEDAAEKAQGDILAMTKEELIAILDERDAAAKAVAAETAPVDGAETDVAKAAEDPTAAVEAVVKEAVGGAVEALTDTVTKAVVAGVAETFTKLQAEQASQRAELDEVKKRAQPIVGPARTRTPDAITKSEQRDALDMQLADYVRKADDSSGDERKGYQVLADEVRSKLAALAA